MVEDLKIVGKLSEELRLLFLEEVSQKLEIWELADAWAKHNHPEFAKNKTCIPLIVGRKEPYTSTPFTSFFPKITNYLNTEYKSLTRVNIQKIGPLQKYPMHVDSGEYFLGKDRYAVCLQGLYRLTVCDKSIKVAPGDVVWFDNKKPHEAVNVGTKERIAIIFDVPKENRCTS